MKTEPVKVGVVNPNVGLGRLITDLEAMRLRCTENGYMEPRVECVVLFENPDLQVMAKRVVK